MFSKIHYADSQETLLRACEGQLAQLIEHDNLVKAASTSAFQEDELRGLIPDKDHFGVLYVGMGAHESYGPNRNADAWERYWLQKRASTFVSHGHYFREHRNRDPKQAIGQIKAARFDPKMDRVEIFVWGHKKKAASEYERARAGRELSCSMSARVPEDICNCCRNRAKSPAEYCEHMTEQRNQYVPEFQKYAFVFNPNPTFFDLSNVERPADRIAHYLQYRFGSDEMAKAASANSVITGAEWAQFEGVDLPSDPLLGDFARGALLSRLAAIEAEFEHGVKSASAERAIASHAVAGMSGELSDHEIDVLRQQRPAALFAHLAKRACLLPLPEFACYVSGLPRAEIMKQAAVQKAASMLPHIFRTMMNACLAPDEFSAGAMDLMDVGGCKDDALQPVLDRLVEKYHCMAGPVAARGVKAAATVDFSIPTLDTDEQVSKSATLLAHCYGLYKLSALHDMQRFLGSDDSEAREAIFVGHNFGRATVDS